MSNIRVDLEYTIHDGAEIKFRSPAECSAITGLIVYYPGADGDITSKEFSLADAHGNNVGDIDHLFAEDVVVKVILDVTTSMAFVQNADTNAYLEAQLAGKAPAGYGLGGDTKYLVDTDDLNDITRCGFYSYAYNGIPANGIEITSPFQYVYHVIVSRDANGTIVQDITTCGASSSDANYHVRRVCGFGGWSPWEYVNPPMQAGVEYRTTERWNGSTVYAKANSDGTISKYLSDGTVVPSGTRVASNLVSSETTPTTENIINWQYE